jgi:acetyl esterase
MAETFLPQYPQLTPAMRSLLERMHRAAYPPIYTLTALEARAT